MMWLSCRNVAVVCLKRPASAAAEAVPKNAKSGSAPPPVWWIVPNTESRSTGCPARLSRKSARYANRAAACWSRKDLQFGPGVVIGPCMENAPVFTCPKGQETMTAFLDRKCGPTPEDCGCTLVEECPSRRDWNATNSGRRINRQWIVSGTNSTITTISAGSATMN